MPAVILIKHANRQKDNDSGSPNGPESFRRAHRATWHHDVCRAVSIVAIIGSPDVGACPTTLITMSQAVYICESPAEVKRKLEAVTTPDVINCEKSAVSSRNSWNTLMNAIQHPAWVQ
jgi:hypothetical protein